MTSPTEDSPGVSPSGTDLPAVTSPSGTVPPDLGSTLLGVVRGTDARTVQQWHSAREVAEIARVVTAAGWQFAHLDGAAAQTKSEILVALGEALDFPSYYRPNLDALADCLDTVLNPEDSAPVTLGESAPGEAPGVILLWDAWQIVAESDPRTFAVLLEIFAEHEAAQRPFAVLLRRA